MMRVVEFHYVLNQMNKTKEWALVQNAAQAIEIKDFKGCVKLGYVR